MHVYIALHMRSARMRAVHLRPVVLLLLLIRTQNEANKNTANRIRVISSVFSFFSYDHFAYGLIDR